MNAMAPPFPTNPTTGEWFGNWVWNGVRWVCGPSTGVRVVVTTFSASGPYMPSNGLVTVVVECVGGGGSGGAAIANQNVDSVWSGGGGASGGYSKKALAAAIVAGGVNVTVGAGGDASQGGTAADGQPTTFGALCTALGGGCGGASAVGSYGGGPGGPGIGDVAFPGAGGFAGPMLAIPPTEFVAAQGGMGGTMFGGNGIANTGKGGANLGVPGYPGTGAGGSGGCINQSATAPNQLGGNGGSGLCIVTEYCWADGSEDDCLNPPVNVNARVAVTHVPWQGPGPCPPGWQGQVGWEGEGD